ncbi:MFS transporter [Georgenia ruanii]|uniref:MFS transporter n=1 Tax=Georgenia ruanii TaxID=348442 RepID=A0A7J9UQZ9_9MICO|nr:MFS transporter [Georgenia ruanii]MPV87041.1 MFS transporter [Georgenia ruanii]
MSPFRDPAPPRLAFAVWGAGLAAYVVAVTGRTSLGVAGLQAADRFEISAATLSLFSVVQLAVYAAAQIPVGLLLDRIGSRRLIAAGAMVLAAGQLMLAVVDTLPMALAARVLVGVGDATAFVSVLRLVPAWFPSRRVPVLTQMTGIIGSTGQIISAVPFMAGLLRFGWTPAFVSLAALGVFMGIVAAIVVRDRPPAPAAPTPAPEAVQPVGTGAEVPPAAVPARREKASLRAVMGEPGTWLGFFTHFVSLFPTNTFVLLWGVPFLTAGQGRSAQEAAALLTVSALAGVVMGPVAGELQARHPLRRSWLVLGATAFAIAAWTMVLVPTTPRPTWQLVVLVLALTSTATASNVGFDFARTFVPPARLGTATGVVNVGGFVASLASIYLVGFVLDLVRPDGHYVLADFRAAFAVQAVVWIVGLTGLLTARHATRRRMAEGGVVVPPVREVIARMRNHHREG